MIYIVATPIGNMEDLSYRQAKTIAGAEVILSEDTRSTGYLLEKIKELFNLALQPQQRLISYYKEKEFEKLPEIMDLIDEDKEIALISQAGMPLVSDPGLLLVQTLVKKNIPFTVIPGPTAATTTVAYSGLSPENSLFIGFLPKKASHVKKMIQQLLELKKVNKDIYYVAYESPMRIQETLNSIDEIYPTAQITIGRELTKKFEEILRGTPKSLAKKTYRGEVTLIVY